MLNILLRRVGFGLIGKTPLINLFVALSEKVRSAARLHDAWKHVRDSGRTSESKDTRAQVVDFEKNERRHLKRIQEQLRKSRFQFGVAKGVALKRPGKSPRPLVVTSIECRIVQRAILDVLVEQPIIKQRYITEHSFGAVPGGGVGAAIGRLRDKIQEGYRYFIRTDIQNFFSHMPRAEILEQLRSLLPNEDSFHVLVQEASSTKLSNAASLGNHIHLFPNEQKGMPQGSSLSALFGNLDLYEFDKEFNERSIACIRYVDDLILLSPKLSHTRAAFESARKYLNKRGYDLYDPNEANGDKAVDGDAKDTVSFLGCELIPGLIRPNEVARNRLLAKIDSLLEKTGKSFLRPSSTVLDPSDGVGPTLQNIRQLLQAWRGQYDFCNDKQSFKNLDGKIADRVSKYFDRVQASHSSLTTEQFMSLLGIPAMAR